MPSVCVARPNETLSLPRQTFVAKPFKCCNTSEEVFVHYTAHMIEYPIMEASSTSRTAALAAWSARFSTTTRTEDWSSVNGDFVWSSFLKSISVEARPAPICHTTPSLCGLAVDGGFL